MSYQSYKRQTCGGILKQRLEFIQLKPINKKQVPPPPPPVQQPIAAQKILPRMTLPRPPTLPPPPPIFTSRILPPFSLPLPPKQLKQLKRNKGKGRNVTTTPPPPPPGMSGYLLPCGHPIEAAIPLPTPPLLPPSPAPPTQKH